MPSHPWRDRSNPTGTSTVKRKRARTIRCGLDLSVFVSGQAVEAEVIHDQGDARRGHAAPVGHQVGVGEITVVVVEDGGQIRVPGAGVDADLADPVVGPGDHLGGQPVTALVVGADGGDGADDDLGVGAGIPDGVDQQAVALDEVHLPGVGQVVAAQVDDHRLGL